MRTSVRRFTRTTATAALVVLLPTLSGAVPATSSQALFTDAGMVVTNTVASDTLAAPSGLTVANGGGGLVLNWTATATTYADGYKIYRGDTSGGPFTEVGSVVGRTTVTWTDTNPGIGTKYYVVKAYRYNWLSGQTTVGQGTAAISDTFNGSGALGVTETVGLTWLFPNAATWTRTGGTAQTSTAIGSNPMAVIDAGTADVDVTVNTPTGSGEAVYLRVADGTNWVRARVRMYQTSYQYYTTEYEWQDMRWADSYQRYQQQQEVSYQSAAGYWTMGNWQGYKDSGGPTGCRSTAPATPSPVYGSSGQQITMYRYQTVGSGSAVGCNNNPLQYIYQLQSNSRTETYTNPVYSTKWVNSPYTLGANESFTGASGEYVSGTPDYLGTSACYNSIGNPGRCTNIADGTGYRMVYQTTHAISSGNANYWSCCADGLGPDVRTTNSRQTGPWTGYTNNYEIIVEKSVAGTITTLATYVRGTTRPTSLRCTTSGSQIQVYDGTTLLGTLTETANQSTTQHGLGLGGPTTSATNALPDFLLRY